MMAGRCQTRKRGAETHIDAGLGYANCGDRLIGTSGRTPAAGLTGLLREPFVLKVHIATVGATATTLGFQDDTRAREAFLVCMTAPLLARKDGAGHSLRG